MIFLDKIDPTNDSVTLASDMTRPQLKQAGPTSKYSFDYGFTPRNRGLSSLIIAKSCQKSDKSRDFDYRLVQMEWVKAEEDGRIHLK